MCLPSGFWSRLPKWIAQVGYSLEMFAGALAGDGEPHVVFQSEAVAVVPNECTAGADSAPGRYHLDEQAHCRGGERTVRPNDLWVPASFPIAATFVIEVFLSDESYASEAWPSGHRHDYLPRDGVRIVLMHVHADVDERDHRPSAAFLKLRPPAEAIDAPKDNVTCPQCLEVALPVILNGPDLGVGVDALDHPLGDNHFGALRNCIREGHAHCAVQVWKVGEIRIENGKPAHADVCQLLGDV